MSGRHSTDHRKKMISLVDQWKQSGQTQSDFSASQGLSGTTLGYWVRKMRRESLADEELVEARFTMLKTEPTVSEPVGQIEIVYPNGVLVRIPSNTDTSHIQALIRTI